MKVRPLRLTDNEAWQVLYRGYAKFYQVPMDDEILSTVWAWMHADQPMIYGLGLEADDGSLVGLMHYRAMPSPLRGRMVGFLDDLFISPESRGKGGVQALFKGLQEAAVAKGWPVVRWITAQDNQRARAVYDQCSDKTHWVTYQLNLPDAT